MDAGLSFSINSNTSWRKDFAMTSDYRIAGETARGKVHKKLLLSGHRKQYNRLMRVLYLCQYFPPEIGATQIRAYEMAKNLVAMGHRVTMMTEVPNHPSGVIRPEYRKRFRVVEQMHGIEVIRSWVYATPDKTFRTRLLFYVSYMVTTIVNSLLLGKGKYDVVYATSPPLFVGLAGLVIARMRRVPFVFEVRDLWPEAAVELGELQGPHYIRWAHAMADYCYKRARGIVCVTQGIYTALAAKRLPERKLFIVKNGTNPDRYRYVFERELEEKRGWKGRFVVLYAGVHGVGQGLETVLEAASALLPVKPIHFVFIGEGPRKRELMAHASRRYLSNVEFLPEVSADEIAKYISLSSLCLVPLKKNELFKGALPSKMFDSWACGKPILLTVDGEARAELELARGGVFVEPENASAMARAIMEMYRKPEQVRQMGENGGRYILEQGYDRAVQARKLAQILQNLL
jgi:glycosyltransferase involved in cell wall biosynthesis